MKKETKKNVFKIDRNNLVQEWNDHSEIYGEYARKLADAKFEYEKECAILEVMKADLDKKIRANPEKYEIKLTENSIKNCITCDKKIIDQNKKILEIKHNTDILQAAIYTFEHRKKALENLVTLLLGNFYSMPKISDEDKRGKFESLKRKKYFGKRN